VQGCRHAKGEHRAGSRRCGWVRRYGRREREAALGHCAGRPGPDVRTSPSLARHQRTPQHPRVTCSPWKPAAASSNASRARAARKVFATRQPTMRRENTSVMNVAYATRDHQFGSLQPEEIRKPAAGRTVPRSMVASSGVSPSFAWRARVPRRATGWCPAGAAEVDSMRAPVRARSRLPWPCEG
jgi:hypothetical protein